MDMVDVTSFVIMVYYNAVPGSVYCSVVRETQMTRSSSAIRHHRDKRRWFQMYDNVKYDGRRHVSCYDCVRGVRVTQMFPGYLS